VHIAGHFYCVEKQCFGSSEDLHFTLRSCLNVIYFLKDINGFPHCIPCISVVITVPLVACLGRRSYVSDKAALLAATITEMSFF
jgi:hypothetical protein